jgi:flagella basal body P-ring formation protein FlgA
MRAMLKRLDLKIVHLAIGLVGLAALLLSAPATAQLGALPGAQPGPTLHDVPALRAAVERFAGAAARLDARLVVPHCPAPALSWARSDVVRADCADPAWTLYVPVAVNAAITGATPAAARAKPAIRRGDRVAVLASGPGFVISMDAEAERDADGARVALKGPAGRRFTGRIEDGGRVVLAR